MSSHALPPFGDQEPTGAVPSAGIEGVASPGAASRADLPARIDAPSLGPQPSLEQLTALDMEWLSGSGELAEVVISSRVRLARNLRRYRFPNAASAGELQAVLGAVVQAVHRDHWFREFVTVDLHQVPPMDLHVCIEKHLLSPMHAQMVLKGGVGRALLLGSQGTMSAMINEEDHLRLQVILPGLELEAGWKRLSELDDRLEAHLDFAWSEELGFLSACPSNVGTGLRASVMLHLPALALANALDAIKAQISGHVGLAVRGMFGEGSGMQANMLQISNQISLGPAEDDLIARVRGVALRIVEQELLMRDSLKRDHGLRLADRVWRAVGLLRNARLLTAVEAFGELSLVRLGVEIDILPPIPRETLNHLLVSVCPATVQRNAHAEDAQPKEVTESGPTSNQAGDTQAGDVFRARLVRRALQGLGL